MPCSKLWIVGDGKSRPQLEALQRELKLEESVTFWGERRDPHSFLRGADVFVLSSRSEGLPMSLLEAMAVGLPVIVSDAGGMPEVVGSANAGFVVPIGDVQSLASAMRTCAADAAGMRSAGERALTHYQRHFTLEVMASAYMRLYSGQRLVG
jgi:glycosyltransferase involved in cell wall biosynthesis